LKTELSFGDVVFYEPWKNNCGNHTTTSKEKKKRRGGGKTELGQIRGRSSRDSIERTRGAWGTRRPSRDDGRFMYERRPRSMLTRGDKSGKDLSAWGIKNPSGKKFVHLVNAV